MLAAMLLVAIAPAPSWAQPAAEAVRDRIRTRLEAVAAEDLEARGDPVHASEALPAFYAARLYRPAWSNGRTALSLADSLVALLGEASREGLRASDYHLPAIQRTLREVRQRPGEPDARRFADLDLLLTDAFLVYGSHLLVGRVNPETIDPEWKANRRDADLASVLDRALAGEGLRAALHGLLPPQRGYARLREALVRYRQVQAAGGWEAIPAGDAFTVGQPDPRVPALRRRLAVGGDLSGDAATAASDTFDLGVEAAVRRFQERHGLTADGVVGTATLDALNVPVEERIDQVELNLERWRWLPQDLGERHILVNIAAFWLEVIEADTTALTMRVMVGRPYRRTPVFSGMLTYLVLAPYWHVPRNLAVEDQLPLIKRNGSHFAQQRIRVYEGWGADSREIDPASVDWSRMTPAQFPYRLRQDPGPNNALGRVKFMFPNTHAVYLHDTPARELFDRTERAFSSGCIRVERPLELAAYLLQGDRRWSRRALEQSIERWQEQTVQVPRPIPVHLLYWTAWAGDDGRIHFRRDLYGRDARLQRALDAPPPAEE